MVDILRAYYGIQHKQNLIVYGFRDFVISGNQRQSKWLHGYESVKVNYNPANFGGHRHSGSEDVMFFFR